VNGLQDKSFILPIQDSYLDIENYEQHVWHLFVIRSKDREKLQAYLTDKGVQTLIHYPIPPHKQGAYQAWSKMHFPITESIHNEILSLPISPILTNEWLDFVIEKFNSY
jgi:dTDP-4-amino-4,6-dideoxygalactose transaminase